VGATVALVHRARRDDDVEAASGEREGGAPSDAPTGPGDQRDAGVGRAAHIIPAIW
jgi:hypothetical protein